MSMRHHKFERAPDAVAKLGKSLIGKFHKEIAAAKVQIDYVFCRAETDEQGQPKGPALMLHGAPAAGVARIIGLKDRAMGRGDVEVCIDADRWDEEWDEKQKAALIDHELFHFIPKKNLAGAFVFDDLHRPVVTMRQHDYQMGFFNEIAKRHGAASFEVQMLKQMHESHEQEYFGFMIEA